MVFVFVTFNGFSQTAGRLITFTEPEVKVGDSLIIYPELQSTGSLKFIQDQPILDSVVSFLKNNTKALVELQMHTDSRGGNDYNLALTQRRADSLAAFIVRKGIDPGRINPTGKGEKYLLYSDEFFASKDTEEQREALHALNRRVVIKILESQ